MEDNILLHRVGLEHSVIKKIGVFVWWLCCGLLNFPQNLVWFHPFILWNKSVKASTVGACGLLDLIVSLAVINGCMCMNTQKCFSNLQIRKRHTDYVWLAVTFSSFALTCRNEFGWWKTLWGLKCENPNLFFPPHPRTVQLYFHNHHRCIALILTVCSSRLQKNVSFSPTSGVYRLSVHVHT